MNKLATNQSERQCTMAVLMQLCEDPFTFVEELKGETTLTKMYKLVDLRPAWIRMYGRALVDTYLQCEKGAKDISITKNTADINEADLSLLKGRPFYKILPDRLIPHASGNKSYDAEMATPGVTNGAASSTSSSSSDTPPLFKSSASRPSHQQKTIAWSKEECIDYLGTMAILFLSLPDIKKITLCYIKCSILC